MSGEQDRAPPASQDRAGAPTGSSPVPGLEQSRSSTGAKRKTDAAGRDLATEQVFMVKHGILDGWVCAPKSMDMAAVQSAVHRDIFPAGTSAGWMVEHVESEEPMRCSPGLCAEDHTRQHWHVVC